MARRGLLLVAALIALLTHPSLPRVAAQSGADSTISVAFPKFGTPPGWTRYNADALTPVLHTFSGSSIPFPFRSFVRHRVSFRYTHAVPPATYDVSLGLIELTTAVCSSNQTDRLFTVDVNGQTSNTINIFAAAGCGSPYVFTLRNVDASAGELVINARRVAGSAYPPVLSNFIAVRVAGSADPSPSPSDAPPLYPGRSILSLDVGSPSDDGGASMYVLESPRCLTNLFDVAGTEDDARLSTYCIGQTLTYHLPVPPSATYSVRLSFAETFVDGCKPWFRRFSVSAYDVDSIPATRVTVDEINVFSAVGCSTAYFVTMPNVRVGPSGQLGLAFVATKNNAMVSAIDVYRAVGGLNPSPQPLPSPRPSSIPSDAPPPPTPSTAAPPPTPSAAPSVGPEPPTLSRVRLNVGSGSDERPVSDRSIRRITTRGFVPGTVHAVSAVYKSALVGRDFTYSFELTPGVYYITLGFAEINNAVCESPGSRVFNVYVDEQLQLEGFDIADRIGCRKGIEVRIEHSVPMVNVHPMVIRFESIIGDALLSFLFIRPSTTVCTSDYYNGRVRGNHGAHAVPGTYPPLSRPDSFRSYVDTRGDGYVIVRISGHRSHTHYFNPNNNDTGTIQEYTWTNVESGEVISRRENFRYRFPLGVTRLRLSAMDNSCDTNEAETTVTVTGSIQPSAYCYYYNGLSEVPRGGTLQDETRPQFAEPMESMIFPFPDFSFKREMFAMRCTFLLQTDTLKPHTLLRVSPFGTGHALLYRGSDLILDTAQTFEVNTTMPVGLTSFELTYLHTERSIPPKLKFLVDGEPPAGTSVFHDRKTVVPIISELSPGDGQISGGTTVKVTGFGLYQPLQVRFGGTRARALTQDSNRFEFLVRSPAVDSSADVNVTVRTDTGVVSNALTFSYGSVCDSVAFRRTALKRQDGNDVTNLRSPTSIQIGQDGKLYVGSMLGSVSVVEYNRETLLVTSQCFSATIEDERYTNLAGDVSPRVVLGISFHPADKEIRPYVSSGILFGMKSGNIDPDISGAWRNGAVDRLKPGSDPDDNSICLVHDERIVSNLPVSAHDHGPNALVFTQDGDLLIATGGNTNAGLPSKKFGGWWETDMSASILIAQLSKSNFRGSILYDSDDIVHRARRDSSDVQLYATGARNPFAMTMTDDGNVYAVDQGSNCDVGNIASSCDEYDVTRARDWNYTEADWPGQQRPSAGGCAFSAKRTDKVLHVTEGSFYGHANLARGPDECKWIDPYTDLTASREQPPSTYKAPMQSVESSVTGLGQYRGTHFCGSLRGELIMSSFTSDWMYRMRADGSRPVTAPRRMTTFGGLTFAENAHGELLMPALPAAKLFMGRPSVRPTSGLQIFGLNPPRHGLGGGTMLTVGGSSFSEDASVTVGGSACQMIYSTETEVRCFVPSQRSGGLRDVTVSNGTASVTLEDAVLYMNV